LLIANDEEEEGQMQVLEHYKLAVKPQYTRMTIAEIAKKFELPDLEVQLKKYLYSGTSHTNDIRLPHEWHLLDVWNSVKIREPEVVSTDDGQPIMQNILARLQTKNSDIPCFQTVVVDPAPESGQDRDIGLTGMLLFFLFLPNNINNNL
jgi:hypothetical protein